MPSINIIKALKEVLDALFTSYLNLKTFCDLHEDRIGLNFEDVVPTNGTFGEQKLAYCKALKVVGRLGGFIKLLVEEKGTPDIVGLEKIFNDFFEQDHHGQDQFRENAFDLIFFRDNNQDFPFIGRDDFKKEIKTSINESGNLRLIINGARKTGVSYLRDYLTQLNKKFECLDHFIIVDCKTELDKDPSEALHPVHLAEYLLYKMDIEPPNYIDTKDPSQFKERYYTRIADSIKKKCEEKKEVMLLFIDHLEQDMDESVYHFLALFIKKLKQFTTPFILILGGIYIEDDNAISTDDVKEITLAPFEQQDIKNFLKKTYTLLKSKHPDFFEDIASAEFIENAIQDIENAPGYNQGTEKVKNLQKIIKIWHDFLLEEINA